MTLPPSLPRAQASRSVEFPSLRLPDRNRDSWTRAALALTFPNYHDLNAWNAFREASVHLALRNLPEHFAEALEEFFTQTGITALMFESLPVDPQLPPAPIDGKRPGNKQAVSEAVICGLVGMHGEI